MARMDVRKKMDVQIRCYFITLTINEEISIIESARDTYTEIVNGWLR